ncbi:unnamed protein product [Allacma fusca]|uniref:Uncharacterized protein n=1 Tax=Allacma fusca TaxID=39272 RepID=A0A8J2PUL6_9HEXA|nr:unnamed protein product [Allacma fusca]
MCILLHTDMTRTIAFLLSSWILLTAVSYARVFDLDFNPAQNETESRNGTNGSSHFQRVTLDAPTTNVGDTIFKGINLTLMSTREHNWLDWEISNRKKISTLTLYGRFGPKDFRFFLSNFTGIHELSVGRGRYLCPQFDLKRNNSEVKSYNNVSTFRVFRITIECKGEYRCI